MSIPGVNMAQFDRVFGIKHLLSRRRKRTRILARQIARSEHYIKARPLLNNGRAWRS